MFKFFKNGKEIAPPKRIKWHFASKPDALFESAPDNLEINQNFWRKKLEIPTEVEIMYVEDPAFQMVSTKITPIQEDDCTTTATTTVTDADSGINDGGSNSEFSVSEEPEHTVYSAKPKAKRKAAKLSNLPDELDGADGTPTE